MKSLVPSSTNQNRAIDSVSGWTDSLTKIMSSELVKGIAKAGLTLGSAYLTTKIMKPSAPVQNMTGAPTQSPTSVMFGNPILATNIPQQIWNIVNKVKLSEDVVSSPTVNAAGNYEFQWTKPSNKKLAVLQISPAGQIVSFTIAGVNKTQYALDRYNPAASANNSLTKFVSSTQGKVTLTAVAVAGVILLLARKRKK